MNEFWPINLKDKEPAMLAMQVDGDIASLLDHRVRHVQEVDGPEWSKLLIAVLKVKSWQRKKRC